MDFSVKCFLCEKKLISSSHEWTLVKERGIRSMCENSKKIGDNKYKLLEGQSEIKVHEKCRVAYLVANKAFTGSSNSSEVSTRSFSSTFDYKKLCLICQKDYYQSIRKKCIISSDEIKEKLLEVAKLRNDLLGSQVTDLILRVQSLTEAKARYHRTCLND